MCFSAGASFAGGAVISAIGVVTIRKARNPAQKLFSAIPLLFAFQQFSEGVLWLTIPSGDVSYIQIYATYFYLLMALVIWPFMLPYSVYKMEFDLRRKKLINRFFTGGVILSIYYAFCLVKFHVNPSISGFHVEYINDFPVKAGYLAFAIYLISTIAPLFLSTVKKMNLFGILITISCFVTGIFYKEFLTSVWCFFAALISAVIYFIIKESDSSGLILG